MHRRTTIPAAVLLAIASAGCEPETSSSAPEVVEAPPPAAPEEPAAPVATRGPSQSHLGKARDRATSVIEDAERRSREIADSADDP